LDGLDFSPDGGTLAVSDYEGVVHFLQSESGHPVRDVPTDSRYGPLGVRFSADGQTVVARPMTTCWQPILLLDPATGAVRHRFRTAGKEGWHVWSSCLTPDGKQLLTACRVYQDEGRRDDLIVTWDIATGKELRRFPGTVLYHTAISPDGRV